MDKDTEVTITSGDKSVKTTLAAMAKAADAISLKGGGSNSQKLITDYVAELIKHHDEMDRVCEPYELAIDDILAQAKANKIDTDALKETVKFKRATEQKRKKMSEKAKNTELYLSFLQLSLF